GVPMDYDIAVRLARRAAEQGIIDSQYILGLGYLYGRGVPRDVVEAYIWCQLAANQGYKLAKSLAPEAAANLTKAQLAGANERIKNFRPRMRHPDAVLGRVSPDAPAWFLFDDASTGSNRASAKKAPDPASISLTSPLTQPLAPPVSQGAISGSGF